MTSHDVLLLLNGKDLKTLRVPGVDSLLSFETKVSVPNPEVKSEMTKSQRKRLNKRLRKAMDKAFSNELAFGESLHDGSPPVQYQQN